MVANIIRGMFEVYATTDVLGIGARIAKIIEAPTIGSGAGGRTVRQPVDVGWFKEGIWSL